MVKAFHKLIQHFWKQFLTIEMSNLVNISILAVEMGYLLRMVWSFSLETWSGINPLEVTMVEPGSSVEGNHSDVERDVEGK
jgi:hypothetical protein